MKRIVIPALSLLIVGGLLYSEEKRWNTLTTAEKAEGWQVLFNGSTYEGWRGYRMTGIPKAGWEITDGMLKTVPKVNGRELITVRKFTDFDLTWEWRIAPSGNNGVKYLVTEQRPDAPGLEYQMIDDKGNEDSKVGPKFVTAAFYEVLPPLKDRPLKAAGEWNQSRILVQGNHVEHWLNGRKVLEYELGSEQVKRGVASSKFKKFPDFGTKIPGHIMLTYHWDECWYRNIKIRDLSAK